MPDHVHILLYVTEAGHEHLSQIIGWYKKEVNNCARQNIYHGKNLGEVVPATDEGSGIFIRNYNDQIIYKERSVDTVIQYIKMNPWRRAVIRAHPNYFSTLTQITLNGIRYQAYGNLQLLRCPFMDQVVVHRADDAATRLRHRDRWLHTAMNGGFLAGRLCSCTCYAERLALCVACKLGSGPEPNLHSSGFFCTFAR